MQLSELFRRGVVTPLSDGLEVDFAEGYCTRLGRVEFLPIASQALFEEIWESDLIGTLNSACSVAINDYEEESIPYSRLEDAIKSLSLINLASRSDNVRQFRSLLIELMSQAKTNGRPVYFIL